MNKIFLTGGKVVAIETNSNVYFDTKHHKWVEAARMAGARSNAACAVFGGRIVACGG